MGKIRSSLSAKIFLGIAAILLMVCLLMFGVLRIFMPQTYENELTAQLSANLHSFADRLQTTPTEQWENALLSFCMENNVGATIFDENQTQVVAFFISVYTVSDGSATDQNENASLETATYSVPFEYKGKSYTITVLSNANAVNQIADIFPKVFPYVLIIILVISTLTAFFYSRFLAKPIVDISNVSKRMAALDMTWRCDTSRSDEIGVLAINLTDMAARLDSALHELQSANQKLKADIDREREQDKRRRDFFSAISHELKTPVTILKGELDGMILNVGKFKDRDKYLQEAYQTTEAIDKLIREILTLARLDTLSLNLQDFPLRGLIEQCCEIYNPIAQSKGTIISNCYEGEMIIHGDREQMRTVLSNIIGNAVNHSPENSSVNICMTDSVLSVENTGVHINEMELLQVWEPFYRTDKSRSRDTGGSGLGLYIVKAILDLHGFDYRLENMDTGMRFSIRFT